MKRKYFITTKGMNWYLNGIDITYRWYDFFSGLTMEQEKDCGRLFIKRYAKKIVDSKKVK